MMMEIIWCRFFVVEEKVSWEKMKIGKSLLQVLVTIPPFFPILSFSFSSVMIPSLFSFLILLYASDRILRTVSVWFIGFGCNRFSLCSMPVCFVNVLRFFFFVFT